MNVSVVIPTYRAAGFLRATLDSVAAQTHPPAEVLIVDDGSPDDTCAVAEAWAAAATFPVRVLRMPRNSGGPAGPLNCGIAAAIGDVIAPLDHDDLMDPEKLRLQVEALTAAPDVGTVSHGCVAFGDATNPSVPPFLEAIDAWVRGVEQRPITAGAVRVPQATAYSGLVHRNHTVSCSTMLFRKDVWRAVGGFEPRYKMSCDFAFAERVCRRYDLAYVTRPLVQWRRHADCLTDVAGPRRGQIEAWTVLNRFRPNRLDAEARTALSAKLDEIADYFYGEAYKLREAGRADQALVLYGTLLRHRPSARTLLAAAKAVATRMTSGGRPA